MPRVIRIPTPALVVLCGPAGSGKSTFARRHFAETAIVSSDRCRAMIADDEGNIRVSADAFQVFHLLIDLRLRHGRLAVADSTAVRREARRDLLRLARRHQVPAILIAFDVSPERAQTLNARRKGRRVAPHVIQEQWARLQETLRTVRREGFAQAYVLEEGEVTAARVVLTGAGAQGARAGMDAAGVREGH